MRNEIIVEKLVKYCNKLIDYCKGLDYDSFASDIKLVEACVFNLSQIGELANRIDSDFAKFHAEIPWRILYGLRNRIVHDYEGVNLQLIWEIISKDIPDLLIKLEKIL